MLLVTGMQVDNAGADLHWYATPTLHVRMLAEEPAETENLGSLQLWSGM